MPITAKQEISKQRPTVWENFQAMPPLYQHVRINNIHRVKSKPELFDSRLQKLIEANAEGEMIGDWHDFGRLLIYQATVFAVQVLLILFR